MFYRDLVMGRTYRDVADAVSASTGHALAVREQREANSDEERTRAPTAETCNACPNP